MTDLQQQITRLLNQRYPDMEEIPKNIVKEIIDHGWYVLSENGRVQSFRNLPFSITRRLTKARTVKQIAQGLAPKLFQAYVPLTIEKMYFLILVRFVPPLLEYRDAYFEDRISIPFVGMGGKTIMLHLKGVDRFYGLRTPLLEFVLSSREEYEMKFPIFLRPRRVPWEILSKWLWKMLSSYQSDMELFWSMYRESTVGKHGRESWQKILKDSQSIPKNPRAIYDMLTVHLNNIRPRNDLEEMWGIVISPTDAQRHAFRDYNRFVVGSLPFKTRSSRLQQLATRRLLKSQM